MLTTPLLIMVTGPVGAGKSTTSLALAHALRHPARAVAVIDMDQLYGFVRQQDGYGEPAAWVRARHGAAALARAWFTEGIALVIVEGEFFTADELRSVVHDIPAHIPWRFFTLRLSYAQALARVQADPSRGASKDPAFLRQLHAQFAHAAPFLEAASVIVDTDGLSQDTVVARLLALIDGGVSKERVP